MTTMTKFLPPLAAAFAMCAAAHPSPVDAATMIPVTNCHDSGPGSLRNAVAMAPDGATIDLTNLLSCRRITLYHGQIEILQNSLRLIGPGASIMRLDGNRMYRVLRHRGTGTLQVSRLTITNGLIRQPTAFGGCVRSDGSIELDHVLVCHCKAEAVPPGHSTRGGAIDAAGNVTLVHSRVFSNVAVGLQGLEARGGGIANGGDLILMHSQLASNLAVGPTYAAGGGAVTAGTLTLYRSRITGNKASAPQTEYSGAYAGAAVARGINATYSLIDHNAAPYRAGLYSHGPVNIKNTTISDNVADIGAALSVEGPYSESVIAESTISGNVGSPVSGVYFQHDAGVYNSTIAFNRAGNGVCNAAMSGAALYMESVIVAKNACVNDLAWQYNTSINNSLIGKPTRADWISADPRLAPLAYNGGPTPTHALLSDSPAINRGANPLEFLYDQRGPGYPRVKGAFPDIGATER